MRQRRSLRRVGMAGVLGVILVAGTWSTAGPVRAATHDAGTATACIRTDLDVRAPYKDGTCPDGFRSVLVATVESGGVPVCIKPKTDWRVPYADGSCPDGYQLVRVGTVVTDGELVCVKPKTDVRAPDRNGCPAGFTPTRLATDGTTSPPPPDLSVMGNAFPVGCTAESCVTNVIATARNGGGGPTPEGVIVRISGDGVEFLVTATQVSCSDSPLAPSAVCTAGFTLVTPGPTVPDLDLTLTAISGPFSASAPISDL